MAQPHDPYPKFTDALKEAARQAIKAGYHPHFFLEMLQHSSGKDVAESLIQAPKPSKGFFALAKPPRCRLDLTVEAIVLRQEWYPIFSRDILEAAHKRLVEFNYKTPDDSWSREQAQTSPAGGPHESRPPEPPPVTPKAFDVGEPPPRIKTTTYRILRDTELARSVKVMHGYKCQVCGEIITLSDGNLYAEAHHIQPLGTPHNGPDELGNLLCLCPNHHVMMDYAVVPLDAAKLRPAPGHSVSQEFIDHHNRRVIRKPN